MLSDSFLFNLIVSMLIVFQFGCFSLAILYDFFGKEEISNNIYFFAYNKYSMLVYTTLFFIYLWEK